MKIINHREPFDLDVKRFYLPTEIVTRCPSCDSKVYRDFEEDYLCYPVANTKESVAFHCDHCHHEFSEFIIVKVTVEELKED